VAHICSCILQQLFLIWKKSPAYLKKNRFAFQARKSLYVLSDLWIVKSCCSEKQIFGYISHRRFIWYITQHGAWFDLLCTQAKETETKI